MDISIIIPLAFHEQFISVKEQKELLTHICNNSTQAEEFIEEIHDYVANDLKNESYFNEFMVELLLNTKDNESQLFNIFLQYIKTDKEHFILLLEKFKAFNFFHNNFDNFEYNQDEINKIKSFFNFSQNSIQVPVIDYGIKRDIFDTFGIIPKILATAEIDSIHDLNFKFIIKSFHLFTKQEQIDIVLHFFKPEYKNFSFYYYFYDLFKEQNNDIIFSLFSKKEFHSVDTLSFFQKCFSKDNLNYSHLYHILISYRDFSDILPFSLFEKIYNFYENISVLNGLLFIILENPTFDYYHCKSIFFEKYPYDSMKRLLPFFEEYETQLNIKNF